MKHNNPSYGEWFQRLFNMKSGEQPSNEVLDYITPIVEVQPRVNIIRGDSAVNNTTASIYTTPADKDFYLTYLQLSFIKDATATATYQRATVTIDGVNRRLLQHAMLTLTAQHNSTAVSFDPPLKIDRGTAIASVTDTAVGNITHTISILGYTVEVTK